MGVSDGQPVNASVTNPAFINKNIDDQMPNKLDFTNNDPISGPSIINSQRNWNSFASFLGMAINGVYNLLPTWATSNRGLSTNTVFQRVAAIDTAFDPSTGHEHTGVAGDAPQISALTLVNIPLIGVGVQGTDLVAVVGTSTVVTTQFSGYTPSTSSGVKGAVVNAPYNKIIIRNSATDSEYFDAFGNTVYGRLTYSASVWTLSYYSEISGTETAYTFTSSGVRFYFQLLTPVISASGPVYSDLFFVPSSNATADVLVATATIKGKVQLATTAQDIAAATSAGTANATVANADHTHKIPAAFVTSAMMTLTGVTAGTYTNVTVDTSGRVTFGSNGQSFANISSATSGVSTVQNYFGDTSGGAFNFTLPLASANAGVVFNVMNITFGGANLINVLRTSTDLINGATSDSLSAGENKRYRSNGVNWYIM